MDNDLWAALDAAEFALAPGCWRNCGSFCCSWQHPTMRFTFLQRGGTLFYMEKEFQYFKNKNRISNNKISSYTIAFSRTQSLQLYYAPCPQPEQCRTVFDRTLYCKLYPFLPLVALDGTIEDLGFISPYDITLARLDASARSEGGPALTLSVPHGICSIKALKDEYLHQWRHNPLLRHPYIVFYLRAAQHCYNQFCNALDDMLSYLLQTGSFWKRWEVAWLGGKFFDKKSLSEALARDYITLAERYGDFL